MFEVFGKLTAVAFEVLNNKKKKNEEMSTALGPIPLNIDSQEEDPLIDILRKKKEVER